MLMITAMIQPFRLEYVRSELLAANLVGMTVTECAGNGVNAQRIAGRFGGPDVPEIRFKIKIEIVVPSSRRDDAIDAIVHGARLGNFGDGKIFVSTVEKVVSIRTGRIEDDFDDLPLMTIAARADRRVPKTAH